MKNKQKVSIVILLYNSEKHLKECLNSAINQTYKDLDIVVVVNGECKDNTEIIAKEYAIKDNRIRVVKNYENSILTEGLKLGFDNMQGEYFTILEGDDVLSLTAIDDLINIADNTNANMITGEIKAISEQGDFIGLLGRPKFTELTPKEYLKLAIPYMDFLYHGKLFKRELYKDIVLPPAFLGHDVLLTFQLAINANIVANYPKVVHYFRQHTSSISHNMTISRLEDSYSCKIYLDKIFKVKNLYKDNPKMSISRRPNRCHQFVGTVCQSTLFGSCAAPS